MDGTNQNKCPAICCMLNIKAPTESSMEIHGETVPGLFALQAHAGGWNPAIGVGCMEQVMDITMARVPTAQWVQRQACQSLRNIAGRCPELRHTIKQRGAEAVLRRTGATFPTACRDVSSAALRDLGLDDYKT